MSGDSLDFQPIVTDVCRQCPLYSVAISHKSASPESNRLSTQPCSLVFDHRQQFQVELAPVPGFEVRRCACTIRLVRQDQSEPVPSSLICCSVPKVVDESGRPRKPNKAELESYAVDSVARGACRSRVEFDVVKLQVCSGGNNKIPLQLYQLRFDVEAEICDDRGLVIAEDTTSFFVSSPINVRSRATKQLRGKQRKLQEAATPEEEEEDSEHSSGSSERERRAKRRKSMSGESSEQPSERQSPQSSTNSQDSGTGSADGSASDNTSSSERLDCLRRQNEALLQENVCLKFLVAQLQQGIYDATHDAGFEEPKVFY